jgi:hypothetical protein
MTSSLSLYRIISAPIKRVASHYPVGCHRRSLYGPVFLYCIYGILGTCRIKPAAAGQDGGYEPFINPDKKYYYFSHCLMNIRSGYLLCWKNCFKLSSSCFFSSSKPALCIVCLQIMKTSIAKGIDIFLNISFNTLLILFL